MALQLQGPELGCLDPDTYKKYFRALCWSGTRYLEKRSQKKIGKKDKPKRSKSGNTLAVCYAPLLLGNPSQFAVYATVRKSILSRWRLLLTPAGELSDDSDNDDPSAQIAMPKLPKITGIGLRTVFALIAQARVSDTLFCERALCALLDVLQGHAPEDLAQEPQDIISSLHAMLVEVAGGAGPGGRASAPGALTALGSSCLIALSVARGEAELILNAVASLIMTESSFSEQYIQIPCNVTTLQRSVQSVLLGAPARNQWLTSGVPQHALAGSFPVELPPPLVGAGELVVRALASDGCFLYVFTSKGLLKIGSGYGDTIRQHVYLYKPDFFVSDRHGWLGYCKDKLYARIGRKKTEVYEIDKHSLEVKHVIKLDPGQPTPAEPKSAVFTDGHQLGLILLTNFDNLTIKMYDVESRGERAEDAGPLRARSEVGVHLLRRRTLALGRAPYDDGQPRRAEPTAPLAMELDDGDDDPLRTVCAGQDFALLTTASGKVYYTGKGTSLGYKTATPYPGRWILMKETVFTRNDLPGAKKCKVIQAAAGHEGAHAVLVLDNGTALFAGVARRGEDGDAAKHRRTPKPTRPKKIFKAEGHFVTYAACNHGSTALVTRQGLLLMFGKDTQNCDSVGVVTGLRHERVMQVALGKAHGVALTDMGQVYTFGINNKGQCGREFGYTKEKSYSSRQQTTGAVREEPRLCLRCRQSPAPATRRAPSQVCSCEESEGACSACGACRCCGEVAARVPPPASDQGDGAATPAPAPAAAPAPSQADARSDKENVRYPQYEGHTTMSEADREASPKVSCLPPSRLAMPGAHRVCAVACGLHHTVLLTDHGEVLTFGSNQYGQLGAGDIGAHHRVVRVRVPRASAVAAGSNHTAVLTREGELYTFGSYQKGQLGRPRPEETPRGERSSVWYAAPGRVPRMGARHACRAVWVTASGDQTFVQLSQGLINTDTLFSSTVTANHNCIMILPNQPEHTFKCVTISKADGACSAWPGAEQVDFVNSLACLDPLYDVLWCYRPQMRVIKCYNILAYDAHKLQRCCNNEPDAYSPDGHLEYPNYGSMRRLEDFKNLESYEVACNNEEKPAENVALSDVSILKQELAIPGAPGCSVTRMHAALHLLGCLDSLTYAHDTKLNQVELKQETAASPVVPVKEDFLTVNRFESHGGGWGYSGHSVEAIRFMCDTDILLGGFGLFGGRGDYTAKIKLFDIGADGGDHEGDGELLAESDEVVFECAPRDKFPVLFDAPVPLVANRWYVAWACINGPSSDCGSSGQAMVINDEIGFHFKTSKKSNNGTDVNAGQIPCLLYNAPGADPAAPARCPDAGEPVVTLSKNISRNVTVPCFKSLITLMQWSWGTFKETILDTNGQIPINYQKLTLMKHQRRLVYVIRACLRLVRSYINEIYPLHSKNKKSHEYMCYLETILEVRNLVQAMMAEQTPTCAMLPRRPGKHKAQRACYVQFALELSGAVLAEAHDTLAACYHAFFPTPPAKWNHLCSLLSQAKEGAVPARLARELGATCTALGGARSLSDTLHYVVPLTQSRLPAPPGEPRRRDSKVMKESSPAASVATPRPSGAQKPPPIPPRSNTSIKGRQAALQSSQTEWHLLEAVGQLLELVTAPIKQQMMTRACGQPHDHGEARQLERLADACCKLVARIVAELAYGATHLREDMASNTVKHLVTPSRFMRVNQTRAWNTGNGSPDAICFTVDRPGVVLVGVCAYGGLGSYEYSLELLHDVRQLRGATDEANPAHCWVSVEVAHGAFSAADCHHDMVQLKFDKPVPLKEELRYAVRLCNHGGRTANGDCGLPSVKGPDDTTFRFASCSLSFNGTTLARGQIPCLIYYSASRLNSNAPESADSLVSALQSMTLRVAGAVLERAAELFCALRNELTDEDLRRNAAVLQHSPVITTLVPFTLAYLEGLVDSKSVVKVLEMVHKLLPHVAAMNLLVPSAEEFSTTTTHYYTWVESDHPYKQATVTNMRVLFPPSVAWVVLEMDPRSATAQPEDSLTVYAVAGAPRQTNRSNLATRAPDAPYRNLYKRLVQLSAEAGEVEELAEETVAPCMHYNCTYVSVTPRLANTPADWPQKALLVPGNEVIFSLETASDYLTDYNKINNEDARFGFRCLCAGYEQAPRAGLAALEAELVYAGAACAARLLAPDLDIPPLTFSTMMEVQVVAALGGDEEPPPDGCEALLLARGLELSSPPSVHQVLDGQPLLRGVSPERQFLSDFVAGAESTAGGRLARWLAPGPRVEPARCELRAPGGPARPAARLALPVLVRDQHGDLVASPALKVEVVVQRAEEPAGRRGSLPDAPYQPTLRDTMCFHAITMMKAYQAYSFEELRLAGGSWGEGGGGAATAPGALVPAERLAVRAQPDGSYVAAWTPRAPGAYTARCTLDDRPAPQELRIEVADATEERPPDRGGRASDGAVAPAPAPSRLRRFAGRHSSGLRVRASPSLQAEELGRVPPAAKVAFVEEVVNKDGTWVRLSAESVRAYTDGGAGVAWCLQHHRHLDRALLLPLEPCTPPQLEYTGVWSGYGDAQGDMQSWTQEVDEVDGDSNELTYPAERRFPLALHNDMTSESDGSCSPLLFAAEPSKRARAAAHAASPKRAQRRSNGNSEEWWTPAAPPAPAHAHAPPADNARAPFAIPETEIGEPPEPCGAGGRLAQAGTQTSPEGAGGGGEQVSSVSRERDEPRAWPPPPAPPPVAAPVPPAPPAPRKHAVSPSQAECLRAVFAALLWHEGIVHDAIACAAFLKFHPQLPKQGARVVTRAPHEPATHAQRHSVEVSNAGQYLRIAPSTLETLTRSGAEATASRLRKTDIDLPIREEEAVVSVLPPALRALVALWDALGDADELAPATGKLRRETEEKNENDWLCSGIRKKREWKSPAGAKTPYSVRCELCGGAGVPPPLAAHMRHAHPGCRGSSARGYDRAGTYRLADRPPPAALAPPAACGQLAQAYQLWYIYCEKCRDRALKASSSVKQPKTKTIGERGAAAAPSPPDHLAVRENATFLLDLAPLNDSESPGDAGRGPGGSRSPPTPPGSVWRPAPPFQCLPALGAAPKPAAADRARYHSLGRPPPAAAAAPLGALCGASGSPAGVAARVPRSVSMGQAGARGLARHAQPPLARHVPPDHDALSGGGSSLLAQPSVALQRLVGCGEWRGEVSAFEAPRVDAAALLRSPVLAFVLARRDLHAHRQKMDAAVRVNTVRQYAFEALNWLLRSTTQPTCVHDVMWWFCGALDDYARVVPPPVALDDNSEARAAAAAGAGAEPPLASRAAAAGDPARRPAAFAFACAMCPGGRAARASRAAFHALLGSVSALAPSLPPASAAALQAVRCWALHYSPHDRAFLHRSQVFSVISKILSHSEDAAHEDAALGPLHESFHSHLHEESYVWSCPDVTGWCDVSVSSRQGMAGALTDGSTETFWESGDEDRNKAKWLQVAFPGGAPPDRPHLVCVHVDNTRDTLNKTLLVTFLYNGGSSETFHVQDMEVDPKAATWLCYTLPGSSVACVRVKCEMRGPEAAVRVRQVRVLGAPEKRPEARTAPAHVLRALLEADTLRVFRLLTSHVFGKLLEWERGEAADDAAAEDAAAGDDSDLREHVVGILFAGHKLTSLQRQVMAHIVSAIGCEAARVRDDWEAAPPEADATDDGEAERPRPHRQDDYCFEMLCLLLALSGSAVGRAHLAQQTALLGDLLALLHTGSHRVQRQVVALLRRMIAEIPPQKMLAAINYGSEPTDRITLLDHLVCYLAKAIVAQVKVKGAGASAGGGGGGSLTMGGSVTPAPPSAWFVRGRTTAAHAHLAARLLADMAEDRVSPAWGPETRAALAEYATRPARIPEEDRRPERCAATPAIWTALAALCVCERSHLEPAGGAGAARDERARDADARPLCANHDDGSTAAVVECRTCGPLCAECDRFLHLNRAARTHRRRICKEEESAIRIDVHEGCGRAKLFWLLLLVDRRTLKALVEFRGSAGGPGGPGDPPAPAPGAAGSGACRFCGARGSAGLLAIGNVCADRQCQRHGRAACARTLACGHACGGVRGERECLPCLHGCAPEPDAPPAPPLRQDADDMCMICFTDPLQAAPAIQLRCGHVFHLHCCETALANGWHGPRITFSFARCPICKEDMGHWTLDGPLAPVRRLRDEVRRKALMRLEYEGPAAARARAPADLAAYAMERYAYYACHKCGKAYFGGLARCEAETGGRWEPAELVCGACSDVAGARSCPKHGADFLEYKCRYCCSVAVFFCFGTSHFCNACHDDFQRVTNIPKHALPQCPAGPKGEQLPGTADECPLHVRHPPTGEEFALGCGVCRDAHAF